MSIANIQRQDKGDYQCTVTGENDAAPATVDVEVEGARNTTLNSSPDYSNYIATCESIGSFPGETITWSLKGVSQTDGVETRGPTERGDSLFDTTSEFTFPATIENYNVELQCIFGGHQVDKLNGPETRLVDIHNPPEAEGITIDLTSDGTDLTVSCNINNDVDAAIPPMDSFYIYSNGSLITKPVSANSVSVPEPDYDTEYMCVGGNYLGNTTETGTFYPGRTTTPPTPTAPITTEGTTTNTTAPDTTEPVVGPSSPPGTGMWIFIFNHCFILNLSSFGVLF
nr:uncharacterized protein LOC129267300 [Lytechinus pictus]